MRTRDPKSLSYLIADQGLSAIEEDPLGIAQTMLNSDGTLRMNACILAYNILVPGIVQRIKDIHHGSRPAMSYTLNTAITALKIFVPKLLPLTQTIEALFYAFFPDEYSRYKTVHETIYKKREGKIDENVEDVFHRWYAIGALRDFECDDACFLELEVKIYYTPSMCELFYLSNYL
ncbi:hypothetical protein HOY80DRAFT_1053927 [Tuber brumale]|nr:hypothetical protein HOY80DRAFT_1053927 [Tuber brumale]